MIAGLIYNITYVMMMGPNKTIKTQTSIDVRTPQKQEHTTQVINNNSWELNLVSALKVSYAVWLVTIFISHFIS